MRSAGDPSFGLAVLPKSISTLRSATFPPAALYWNWSRKQSPKPTW